MSSPAKNDYEGKVEFALLSLVGYNHTIFSTVCQVFFVTILGVRSNLVLTVFLLP